MARIRTIKPELLDDEKVAELSDAAFRLFISMIVMSDDFGNLRADERLLSRRIWWARGSSPRVAELLRELAESDLIMVYAVRDQIYAHIRGWSKHQRIDNAGTSKIPQPSEGIPQFAASRREPPQLAAGSGREEEGKGMSGEPDAAPPVLIKADPAQLLAEAAVAEINRIANTRYRADSASVVKLCRALVKARHTPDQAVLVIQSKRSWVGDSKMAEYFRPATLLAASNFAKYLDDVNAVSGPAQIATQRIRPVNDAPDLTYSLVATMGLE